MRYHTSRFSGTSWSRDCAPSSVSASSPFARSARSRSTSVSIRERAGGSERREPLMRHTPARAAHAARARPSLPGGSRKPNGYPSILGASLLGGVAGERILFAEPLCAQDTGGHAVRLEIVLHGVRAPLRQLLVVLGLADGIGIAVNLDVRAVAAPDPRDDSIKNRGRFRPELGRVRLERHALQHFLLRGRGGGRGWGRRRRRRGGWRRRGRRRRCRLRGRRG